MLKINKSILIICMISLFLIIGQISASDADLIEINDSSTSSNSMECPLNADVLSLDTNLNEELNDSVSPNNNQKLESESESELDEINSKELENSNDIKRTDDSLEISEEKKDTSGIVMANDNFSCGPASLATVLNKFGLNVSLNELSQHTNTSEDGTSMQSLIDAVKYYNFSAYGIEIDTQNLKENYIVHLNINGCQHWTVISKVTDTHVFLADSTEGNMNFSIDEFDSYFTHKAIAISNESAIDFKEQTISNQITLLDKDQCLSTYGKGLKKKIVGYRIVWKYGFIQKYGWVLRPKVVGGHVSFSQWQYVKGYYTVWGKYKAKEPIYKYYFTNDESLTSAKIKKAK